MIASTARAVAVLLALLIAGPAAASELRLDVRVVDGVGTGGSGPLLVDFGSVRAGAPPATGQQIEVPGGRWLVSTLEVVVHVQEMHRPASLPTRLGPGRRGDGRALAPLTLTLRIADLPRDVEVRLSDDADADWTREPTGRVLGPWPTVVATTLGTRLRSVHQVGLFLPDHVGGGVDTRLSYSASTDLAGERPGRPLQRREPGIGTSRHAPSSRSPRVKGPTR